LQVFCELPIGNSGDDELPFSSPSGGATGRIGLGIGHSRRFWVVVVAQRYALTNLHAIGTYVPLVAALRQPVGEAPLLYRVLVGFLAPTRLSAVEVRELTPHVWPYYATLVYERFQGVHITTVALRSVLDLFGFSEAIALVLDTSPDYPSEDAR
jgi:hypothetical protein